MRLIAEEAGLEAALQLSLHRGGSRLFVPANPKGSVLESIVGVEAAAKIAREWGGVQIEIPHGKKALNQWLKDQGWSQERRSAALKLSRRTVQYWDADKTPPRQMTLL